jgi:hypothetical protein
MTKGEKVVATAEKYLGVVEVPWGSNRGTQIDQWQAYWGMRAEPWCGIFVSAIFREAGVSGEGIPHPAVAEMVSRARAKGRLWNRTGTIPVGSIWMQDGIHTGIVTHHAAGNNYVDIIDGNSNNGVRRTRRSLTISGIYVAIPEAVREAVAPEFKIVRKYEWYLRDRGAKPTVWRNSEGKAGLWETQAFADKAIAGLLNGPHRTYWTMLKPRSIRAGNGKWVIQLGDVYLYGPWRTNLDSVRIAKARIEKQVGRKLELIERPYDVKVRV